MGETVAKGAARFESHEEASTRGASHPVRSYWRAFIPCSYSLGARISCLRGRPIAPPVLFHGCSFGTPGPLGGVTERLF